MILESFFLSIVNSQILAVVVHRLHSAGHLLDACMHNVGLGHLEPGKGYHFPDGYDYSFAN